MLSTLHLFFCTVVGIISLNGCQTDEPVAVSNFAYDINQPDEKYKLPGKLREISGLSWLKGGKIACVQDEDGKIFVYDTKKDELSDKFNFGKDADYEGIAIVGKGIWVLRSNGNLVGIDKVSPDAAHKTYKTKLDTDNDTEGLCYDEARNRLLIACKEDAGKGKELKHKRSIYAFDLETKKLVKDPVYVIDYKALKDSIKNSAVFEQYEGLAEFFDPGKGGEVFKPSGIAIHPQTKDIYIIATVGKLLVVLDPDGNLKRIVPLDSKVFKQPEGITFNKKGTLFISNEGRGGDANILKFKQRKE